MVGLWSSRELVIDVVIFVVISFVVVGWLWAVDVVKQRLSKDV